MQKPSIDLYKDKKRLLFVGGSTLIDNMQRHSLVYIYENLLEQNFPGQYDIVNAATWSSTITDHYHNWDRVQPLEKDRPIFMHNFLVASGLHHHRESLEKYGDGPGFGLKDLEPDVLVISSMWNDFLTNYYLNAFKDGDSILTTDGTDPFLKLWKLTLKYIDDPTDENFDNHFAQVKALSDDSEEVESTIKVNLPLEMALQDNYEEFLRVFIERVRKDKPLLPVVLLSLPLSTDDRFSRDYVLKQMREAGGDRFYWGHKPEVVLDALYVIDKAQRRASRNVSEQLPKVKHVDLASPYFELFTDYTPNELEKLDFFKIDQYHFTPKGNSYFAQQLYDLTVQNDINYYNF